MIIHQYPVTSCCELSALKTWSHTWRPLYITWTTLSLWASYIRSSYPRTILCNARAHAAVDLDVKKISKMHWTTPNWTCDSQKDSIYTTYLLLRSKCGSVSLYDSTTLVIQIRKCTERPQTELEHLTVKSVLHTLYAYPRGPNFGPFRSMTSGFQAISHFIIPHWLPC